MHTCGTSVKSEQAGNKCTDFQDCVSTVSGVYATCGCTYSSTVKVCGILHGNTEYLDYVAAVSVFQMDDLL